MKKKMLLFFIILFLLKPTGLEELSPILNSFMNVFRLISMILILLLYILNLKNKRVRLNKYIILIFIIEVLSIICCLYNKQSCYNAIVYWQGILSLMLLAEIELKNILDFIRILIAVLGTYVLINFLYILFIYDYINYNTIFILGKKNMIILYVFPFIYFLLHLYSVTKNGKKSIFLILMILISLFSIYVTSSATSIFACAILFVYFIFQNNALINRVLTKITAKKILYIIFTFFLLIIVFEIQKYFSFLIKILGKDLTFTGRTFIWNRVIQLIRANPFGYGWNSSVPDVVSLLNWNETLSIGHAHNYILNLVYKAGIITAIVFVIYLFGIAKRIDTCSNRKLSSLMKITFFIFLLLAMFESYPTNCICLFFICYIFINNNYTYKKD